MNETSKVTIYLKGGSLDGCVVKWPYVPLSIHFPQHDEYWMAYHEKGGIVYTTEKPMQKGKKIEYRESLSDKIRDAWHSPLKILHCRGLKLVGFEGFYWYY